MQTFLPYANFQKSAQCLDRQRLGKQRVEAYQILQCLVGEGSLQWKHHPAIKMWKGHEAALAGYIVVICQEWKKRGYKDTVENKTVTMINRHPWHLWSVTKPTWLGNRKFHQAHRSNLVRKSPTHYRQYFPKVADNLPYVWPKGQHEKRNGR